MDSQQGKITNTVIVPAYNEEQGLAVVLDKLFQVVDETYEVIVVDDGSADRTAEVARRFPCRLIQHEANKGKGQALKTGFREARGENVIWIDADDTYPAHLVVQVAEGLQTYDMLVGSRLRGREHIPWFNRIGNWMFRTAIRKLYGFGPQDALTGLWGVKKRYIEALAPRARYAPDAEIGIKAARMRLRMLDIPLDYGVRLGVSKLPSLKAGWEHVWLIMTLIRWKPQSQKKNRHV